MYSLLNTWKVYLPKLCKFHVLVFNFSGCLSQISPASQAYHDQQNIIQKCCWTEKFEYGFVQILKA